MSLSFDRVSRLFPTTNDEKLGGGLGMRLVLFKHVHNKKDVSMSYAHLVLGVDVGTMFDEESAHINMAFLRCNS